MIFAWSVSTETGISGWSSEKSWVGCFCVWHCVQTACGLLDGDHRLDQDTAQLNAFNLLLNIAVGK